MFFLQENKTYSNIPRGRLTILGMEKQIHILSKKRCLYASFDFITVGWRTLKEEAISSFESLVPIYKTICYYNRIRKHYFHQQLHIGSGIPYSSGLRTSLWRISSLILRQPTALHRCQASESLSFICMPHLNVHVFRSRLKENKLFRVVSILTLRRLMSYIYMEHPFLMFLDHTQRRSTVGRTPLDE